VSVATVDPLAIVQIVGPGVRSGPRLRDSGVGRHVPQGIRNSDIGVVGRGQRERNHRTPAVPNHVAPEHRCNEVLPRPLRSASHDRR
jgi:hypothetical protein